MKHLSEIQFIRAFFTIVGFSLLVGCGEKKVVESLPPEEVSEEVLELALGNSLSGLPGLVYTSQAASPIHWQPWTKASLEMAKKSNRLIFAVIAIPQQPSIVEILNSLSTDASAVDEINSNYIPILIDGDVLREFGILSQELCSELQIGLKFPLMVWMNYEGNPVSWLSLDSNEKKTAPEYFTTSHEVMVQMWEEDSDYISKNSRIDQAGRRARILQRLKNTQMSEAPAVDVLQSLRQLTSLYDPFSRILDQAGGLFPAGVLDLLSMSSRLPGLPEEQRERSIKVLGSLLEDILISPMFDPLDGGVFNARRGSSWSFPYYNRDCSSQARVVVSLLNAYEATGDKRALERAQGVLRFIEESHMTESGLFEFGAKSYGDVENWLWLYEDVREILSPEELPVWMAFSGMKESGNLPSELDPQGKYLRANSIAFAKSSEEVAELLGTDLAKVKELLESARKKLLEARKDRLKEPSTDKKVPNAIATFRMITAYANAYRITGEASYRDLAAETLLKAKEHFSDGTRLKAYSGDAPDSLLAARAFVYAVAIQAALDVEAVTLNGEWLPWAGDLSSIVSEEFLTDASIRECPSAGDLMGLAISDSNMLFDDSTLGLLSMSESRLRALNIPLVPALGEKLRAFPVNAIRNPIEYSDQIQATLMRSFSVNYTYSKDTSAALKEALARSPFMGVNRRMASPSDPLHLIPKAGEAIRLSPDGGGSPVKSAADLRVPSLP